MPGGKAQWCRSRAAGKPGCGRGRAGPAGSAVRWVTSGSLHSIIYLHRIGEAEPGQQMWRPADQGQQSPLPHRLEEGRAEWSTYLHYGESCDGETQPAAGRPGHPSVTAGPAALRYCTCTRFRYLPTQDTNPLQSNQVSRIQICFATGGYSVMR